MNERSHQSNCDLVRYLDRSIKSIFQEAGKISGEASFTCKRGLFCEAGAPATNRERRLHTLEEVWAVLWSGEWRIAKLVLVAGEANTSR